ncbi:hypothetical protein IFM89_038965 [Coptis chinensis]|uniref:Uncharacterized protein n=1 Tax=Coptis chinensis TaxID=261450 RepID=A0A835J2I3_9MAGN|nr:hypothetical protein IFM89_038965 [Coptis chinensis]
MASGKKCGTQQPNGTEGEESVIVCHQPILATILTNPYLCRHDPTTRLSSPFTTSTTTFHGLLYDFGNKTDSDQIKSFSYLTNIVISVDSGTGTGTGTGTGGVNPNMTHFTIPMDIMSHPKPHPILLKKPLCTTVT